MSDADLDPAALAAARKAFLATYDTDDAILMATLVAYTAALRRTAPASAEPVAWRVNFADGWGLYHSERSALTAAHDVGNLVQPLYAAPPAAEPVATDQIAVLLPCPFCGGKAGPTVTETGAFHRVECTSCAADMAGDTKADAMAAWNRRTAPASAEPVATEAEELIERLEAAAKWQDRFASANDADTMREAAAALRTLPAGDAYRDGVEADVEALKMYSDGDPWNTGFNHAIDDVLKILRALAPASPSKPR